MLQVGAFTSQEEFAESVNHFLSPEYDGAPLAFKKYFSPTPYLFGWIFLGGLLLIIGRWGILRKAGKKGWHSLIPFLNAYKEYSTVWNGWLGVLADLCIPLVFISTMAGLPSIINYALILVGFAISIPESFKLAKAFGKGKVLGVLMFLPVFKEITRFILGVSKAKFQPSAPEVSEA